MNKIQDYKNEILRNCYANYQRTGIAKYEFIFEYKKEARTAIEELHDEGLIKSTDMAIGMAYPILTEYGVEFCEENF
ncbi:hypothetical protein [Acetoanaerobium noterae]|uniref:hypothetical protein n=1 Tax=Acetoanaerobium noterae TaxID=745369 RepID=UPI00333E7FC3